MANRPCGPQDRGRDILERTAETSRGRQDSRSSRRVGPVGVKKDRDPERTEERRLDRREHFLAGRHVRAADKNRGGVEVGDAPCK